MMYITGKYRWLLALGCWLLVVACSSDSSDSTNPSGQRNTDRSLQLIAYTTNYQEGSLMRAVTAGYSAYTPTHDIAIGLFPIQTYPSTIELPTVKVLRYSNGIWHTQVVVEDNRTYKIYGYMPMQAPISGSVTTSSMTLENVPAVMAEDVCFVSGVKDGKIGDAGDLTEGVFTYEGKANDNYACLLMDHLYAAVSFHFSISESYSALRKIKVKKMELSSTYEKVTAAVTLSTVPATVAYTSSGTASTAVFFEDTDGKDISVAADVTAIEGHLCCYAPLAAPLVNTLTLVSTYDVYDRYDNLIRENCTSTNQLPTLNAVRGECVTINLKVDPTYLYQLSDKDLDNLIELK